MKLIDKDALVAEMKRRISNLEQLGDRKYIETHFIEQFRFIEVYEGIIDFINSLEMKEVDLDKEFNNFLDNVEGVPRMWRSPEQIEWGRDIAKYFFELGTKLKQTSEDIKIGETQIYLEDDGGEPPYDGKQWLDLSCTEYEIPEDKFKDGDKVEIIIRKKKGENYGYSH